jgi:hypothetical protein
MGLFFFAISQKQPKILNLAASQPNIASTQRCLPQQRHQQCSVTPYPAAPLLS